MNDKELKHTGRFKQIGIYLGKFVRMFIYQNDWKVLPMAAIIAGLVSLATGSAVFVTMEGTNIGTFAITCVCIWNGFFNSIQVIVRERAIVKREHRAGLHITSYIAAHVIYQFILCSLQSLVMMITYGLSDMTFPSGIILGMSGKTAFFISILLITFASDMMALMVSAIVHTTTSAMTVMPFLLILQLVFSGGFFSLPESLSGISDLMISKWGMQSLCIAGDYNSLPSTVIWNKLVSVSGGVSLPGNHTLTEILAIIQEAGGREAFLDWMRQSNAVARYEYSSWGLLSCWGYLLLFSFTFIFIAIVFLERIDKDKR